MFTILHLDNTVFKLREDSWSALSTRAEQRVFRQMDMAPPTLMDTSLRNLRLSARYNVVAQKAGYKPGVRFDEFLRLQYEYLFKHTKPVRPKLVRSLPDIFPKDPVTLDPKGNYIPPCADDVALAAIITEQPHECIWMMIQQAKLDKNVAPRMVISIKDFQNRPNDVFKALLDQSTRLFAARSSVNTLISDQNAVIQAGFARGFKKLIRYYPHAMDSESPIDLPTNTQILRKFGGFSLK